MSEDNSGSGAWNKATTLDRLGGDQELFQELVEIFAQESPKLMQKLSVAVSISDAEEVMRGAHSIKGELGCLGGIAAAKVAQELETMARNKELSGAPDAFVRLEKELTVLNSFLRDFITPQP